MKEKLQSTLTTKRKKKKAERGYLGREKALAQRAVTQAWK
jgi:hypothetical protein